MDSSEDGFDNVGAALHVSSFLMERYLEAANIALDLAIANRPQPRLIKRRYSLKQSHQVKSTKERVFRKSDELAKHRHDDACASCHGEIDPPGFALENFDLIGARQAADDQSHDRHNPDRRDASSLLS